MIEVTSADFPKKNSHPGQHVGYNKNLWKPIGHDYYPYKYKLYKNHYRPRPYKFRPHIVGFKLYHIHYRTTTRAKEPFTTDPPTATTDPFTTDPFTTDPLTTDPPTETTDPFTTDPPTETTDPFTTDHPFETTDPPTEPTYDPRPPYNSYYNPNYKLDHNHYRPQYHAGAYDMEEYDEDYINAGDENSHNIYELEYHHGDEININVH